jgi:SlyX protein
VTGHDDGERARLEQRVTDLEERLAWQDRTIGTLDDVVRAFSERVEQLQRELIQLRDTLRGPETGPHDEKPPHY